MPLHQYVLCYGRDPILLETRRQLLEHAGYDARSATDELTVEQHLRTGEVSILVICHTASRNQVEQIAKFHSQIQSSAAILFLSRGTWKPPLNPSQIHDAHSGPAAFLATVGKLCAPQNILAPRR